MSRLRNPHLLALAGYFILTLVLTYPLVTQFTLAIPGDGFDGWQNYWNLWWAKRALIDLSTTPFFTDYLYYPTGASLYFHTLNIINGIIALPIEASFGLIVAYNAIVLLSFTLGGFGTYLLTSHVSRNTHHSFLIAFTSGLVFAFSPFQMAHLLGHMQVFSLEWLPLYVLFAIRALDSRECVKSALLAAFFLVLSTLTNLYFTLYLLIFTALYLSYRLWVTRRARELASSTALILVPFLVVLAPMLVPMVQEARGASYMVPDPMHSLALSADLLAFVTPSELHPLWGSWAQGIASHFTSSLSERTVFVGFVPLALALAAVWLNRRQAMFWVIALLVFIVLALGPALHVAGQLTGIPLPYALLYQLVPFVNIIRAVSRFAVMSMLCLAVLVGLGLQAVIERSTSNVQRRAWIALAAVLIGFEYLAIPYPMSSPDVPSFYNVLAQDRDDYAILELPMNWDRPQHLLYQTVHGKRLLVAYISRPNPLSIVEKTPVLQLFRVLGPDVLMQDPAAIAPTVLSTLNVRYVIINSAMLPPGEEREANLRLVELIFGMLTPIHHDDRITVYRITPPQDPQPFVTLGDGWSDRVLRDGHPERRIDSAATLRLLAPRSQQVGLVFTAQGISVEQVVSFALDGQPVASPTIPADRSSTLTIGLSLHPGWNIVRLKTNPPGLRVTSIDLLLDH